ncbi:c-type cytochrome [Gimesia aquarii]|uniref:Cytochrome c n=1 Tax=Gimesia aquarii TaxID=2527964 RepID=A0A517W4G9_9PLAN|nr:c-type cytochrome [Gimesia aquarii]QDU00153.1 Cytochrome c [Gimesia aquarii]
MRRLLIFSLLGHIFLFNGSVAHSDIGSPPFVSGFDRFARHGEIKSQTGGWLLLSELSCTACHQTPHSDLQPKRGPRLTSIGNRRLQTWIRDYLRSPHLVKPGTTMPDVLHGFSENKKRQTINALAAFLATQRTAYPTIKATGSNPVPYEFWKKGNVKQGQNLYHKIGCVACHEPDETYEPGETKISPTDKMLAQLDPEDIKELGLSGAMRPVKSVPHGNLSAKYTRKALTFFLLDPAQSRPSGRMPNLKLKAVEAADIAAYLLRDQRPQDEIKITNSDSTLIAEGKKYFVELRCVNCHTVQNLQPKEYAKPVIKLGKQASTGCLTNHQKGLPYYPLDDQQQTAIQETLEKLPDDNKLDTEQRLSFQILQLNCFACHEREKQGGVGFNRKPYFETAGHIDLGDEGRIPPTLVGIGYKLQKKWLTKVLNGKGDIRPHMLARMPVFPAKVISTLPAMFETVDRTQRQTEKQIFHNSTKLAVAGRTMLETGCIQCHPIRGENMPGVVGTDLGDVTNRVHANWFREFLLNPGALKPRTRMPTFFPDGKSQNKSLLDGNVDRQIASAWAYLKASKKQPLPEKIIEAKSKNYELVPKKRPIILRTFMKAAGTHAIAVGFPEKVHFAFDAEHMRPAIAWKGRFLDAQGTWFIRFAPPAIPLGESPVLMPAGSPFAVLNSLNQRWPAISSADSPYQFRGFKIDAEGIPTFLYYFQQFEIEDRFEPVEKQTLKRRLKIKRNQPLSKQENLWFRGLTGKYLKQINSTTMKNDAGLTVSISGTLAKTGKLHTIENETDWLIPIPATDNIVIEVNYQW